MGQLCQVVPFLLDARIKLQEMLSSLILICILLNFRTLEDKFRLYSLRRYVKKPLGSFYTDDYRGAVSNDVVDRYLTNSYDLEIGWLMSQR